MKAKLLDFLHKHYLRYHDIVFYLLVLCVMGGGTYVALQISQQRQAREQEILAAQREIPVVQYTIKQKPIYNALTEAGLDRQEVVQIVSKLSGLVNTRRLKPQDEYTLSVENGRFILLLLK